MAPRLRISDAGVAFQAEPAVAHGLRNGFRSDGRSRWRLLAADARVDGPLPSRSITERRTRHSRSGATPRAPERGHRPPPHVPAQNDAPLQPPRGEDLLNGGASPDVVGNITKSEVRNYHIFQRQNHQTHATCFAARASRLGGRMRSHAWHRSHAAIVGKAPR